MRLPFKSPRAWLVALVALVAAAFLVPGAPMPGQSAEQEAVPASGTGTGGPQGSVEPSPDGSEDGGVSLARARVGQDVLRQLLPAMPGGTPWVSIGDQLTANQVPMNLASFESNRSPEEILEFYARRFKELGWAWTGVDENKEVVLYPAISATEPGAERELSVMVMPHEDDKGSTVILGLSDMEGMRQNVESARASELPKYPGADPLEVQSVDEGVRSTTASFDTSDTPDKVEAFYRAQFGRLGYRATAGERGPLGSRVLQFASAHDRWSLAMSQRDGFTLVTAHHGGARGAP